MWEPAASGAAALGGEINYVGSISEKGCRRVRTLLYEAANVMLTRYRGALGLEPWAQGTAQRSTMEEEKSGIGPPAGDDDPCYIRHGTTFQAA